MLGTELNSLIRLVMADFYGNIIKLWYHKREHVKRLFSKEIFSCQ